MQLSCKEHVFVINKKLGGQKFNRIYVAMPECCTYLATDFDGFMDLVVGQWVVQLAAQTVDEL